jgi:DNA-binding response OmpR family regulator
MSKPSIIFVEDDATIRAVITAALTQKGYNVHSFTTGEEGYEAILQHHQTSRICLTDIHLPRMSGFELTKKIRANKDIEQPYIIAQTSDRDASTVQDLFNFGVNDLMFKPLDISSVILRIGMAVDYIQHHLHLEKNFNIFKGVETTLAAALPAKLLNPKKWAATSTPNTILPIGETIIILEAYSPTETHITHKENNAAVNYIVENKALETAVKFETPEEKEKLEISPLEKSEESLLDAYLKIVGIRPLLHKENTKEIVKRAKEKTVLYILKEKEDSLETLRRKLMLQLFVKFHPEVQPIHSKTKDLISTENLENLLLKEHHIRISISTLHQTYAYAFSA